ncbi:hypothetical protein HZ326_20404 [Fusarium oxysporum f. sp. albedinis]|nr:hypothetical protein HZ326_20404 [Fusarium oxysporum f. sp. albedinis]
MHISLRDRAGYPIQDDSDSYPYYCLIRESKISLLAPGTRHSLSTEDFSNNLHPFKASIDLHASDFLMSPSCPCPFCPTGCNDVGQSTKVWGISLWVISFSRLSNPCIGQIERQNKIIASLQNSKTHQGCATTPAKNHYTSFHVSISMIISGNIFIVLIIEKIVILFHL